MDRFSFLLFLGFSLLACGDAYSNSNSDAPATQDQGQAAMINSAADTLFNGAKQEQQMAMQLMMVSMQLESAASALEPCEKTKKKKKLFGLLGSKKKKVSDPECEEQVKRLRDLARQAMMLAMQHQASGNEMAKKGAEAAKAGAEVESEEAAEQEKLDKVADLGEKIKEFREELEKEGFKISGEPDSDAVATEDGLVSDASNLDLEDGHKLNFLYEGELGEKFAWFEDTFGVDRKDLVTTIFEGGSIGSLLAGKGAFQDLSAEDIDAAIAENSSASDVMTLLAAIEMVNADAGDGKLDGISPADGAVAEPIVHTQTQGVRQNQGEIIGAVPAMANTCETHFDIKADGEGVRGYVVSICGDTVHPGAITLRTIAGNASKTDSILANSPHNAVAGYEQWKIKNCNYLFTPSTRKLEVDACRPSQMGSIVINGKTHTGPYFFSIAPLGESIFKKAIFDEVTVWSARENGTIAKTEDIVLTQSLSFEAAAAVNKFAQK